MTSSLGLLGTAWAAMRSQEALQGATNIWRWKWRPIPKLSPPSCQHQEPKWFYAYVPCLGMNNVTWSIWTCVKGTWNPPKTKQNMNQWNAQNRILFCPRTVA
jgi:hypothetical protein